MPFYHNDGDNALYC